MSHHATEVAPWGYASLHHPCPWSVLYVTHEDQCCAKMVYLGGRRAAPGALHRPAQWGLAFFSSFLVTGCTFFFLQAFFAAATPCSHCIYNVKAVHAFPIHWPMQVLPGNILIRKYLRF